MCRVFTYGADMKCLCHSAGIQVLNTDNHTESSITIVDEDGDGVKVSSKQLWIVSLLSFHLKSSAGSHMASHRRWPVK